MPKKPKKVELIPHTGCKGCGKVCKFNGKVTTQNKNHQASGTKFGCNSSKGKRYEK